MTTSATFSLYEWLNPLRLAGPIFDKELRVASRRRRSYVLRCAYVGMLMAVTVYFWLMVVRSRGAGSAVVQASRMAEAGKYIVSTIVWFQFVTSQVFAAALLSDAIGAEIRQRTLDALLVTPVSSVQIVLGKLLSKLLQLILLLAISLPLLASVRVFGGVPWDYVISGLCVTLTTSLFIGALSLLLSVAGWRSHQVFVNVVGWCLLLWVGGGALLLGLSQAGYISSAKAMLALSAVNPFAVMVTETRAMLTGSTSGGAPLEWSFHCVVAFGATVVLLLLAIWRVRKLTITSIVARAGGRRKKAKRRATGADGRRRTTVPVKGSPVVWKETHRPWFARGWRSSVYGGIAILLVIGALVALAFFGTRAYMLLLLPIQAIQLIFIIRLAVSAASTVTREKEARTWPILLATPLENREIVRGKAFGVLRRNVLLLVPLPFLYLILSALAPVGGAEGLHLLTAVVGIVLGLASAIVFLLGLGLYMSLRMKTTTAAVAATLGIYFGLKFCCGCFSPMLLGLSSIAGTSGGTAVFPLLIMIIPACIYVAVGMVFVRLTTRRLRHDVFAQGVT